jgi:CRP/FNR family transcriptional regulator, cyclic AMP receptor protein
MARGIPKEVIQSFQQIPLFSSVSKKGIRAIVSAASEADVRAGTVLVREGDHDRYLYVVTRGEGVVTRGGRRLNVLGVGDFFGELAFLVDAPRSATVTAATDMRVMVFGPREMAQVIEREPVMAHRMLEVMAARLRATERSHQH